MTARRRPIFLVGFMGSGKSTVGRALAGQLGWTFVDTDRRIEEHEGKSIEAIFGDSGEGHFRRLEEEILEDAAHPERVVATGGGAFLNPANRRKMHQAGSTVWLDISLDRVRRRLGGGGCRPLWDPAKPLAQRILFERRRAVYALAGLRIATADLSVEALAERIRTKIQ